MLTAILPMWIICSMINAILLFLSILDDHKHLSKSFIPFAIFSVAAGPLLLIPVFLHSIVCTVITLFKDNRGENK